MVWIGQDAPNEFVNIDTHEISRESLKFIRDNYMTVKVFAEKIVKIPRAQVSLYFNSPKMSWSRANDSLKAAFINVAFWLSLGKLYEKFVPK